MSVITKVFWIEDTDVMLVDESGTSIVFENTNIKIKYNANSIINEYSINNILIEDKKAYTISINIDFRNIVNSDRSKYTGLIDMLNGCISSIDNYIRIYPSYSSSNPVFLQESFECFPVNDIKIKNIHDYLDSGSIISVEFEGINSTSISKYPLEELIVLVDESGNYIIDNYEVDDIYIEGKEQ